MDCVFDGWVHGCAHRPPYVPIFAFAEIKGDMKESWCHFIWNVVVAPEYFDGVCDAIFYCHDQCQCHLGHWKWCSTVSSLTPHPGHTSAAAPCLAMLCQTRRCPYTSFCASNLFCCRLWFPHIPNRCVQCPVNLVLDTQGCFESLFDVIHHIDLYLS